MYRIAIINTFLFYSNYFMPSLCFSATFSFNIASYWL